MLSVGGMSPRELDRAGACEVVEGGDEGGGKLGGADARETTDEGGMSPRELGGAGAREITDEVGGAGARETTDEGGMSPRELGGAGAREVTAGRGGTDGGRPETTARSPFNSACAARDCLPSGTDRSPRVGGT